MTISAIHDHPSAGYSLTGMTLRLLEFLHAKVSNVRAVEDLERLSDRDLLDVGLERHDIQKRIDSAMGKISFRSL